MTHLVLTGAAALLLLAAPAMAQEASSGDAGGSAATDQQVRDTAIQSAEGAGIQDVGSLEGAFVLQGIYGGGTPVLMVVGPAGELLAIAAPMAAQGAQGTGGAGAPEAGGAGASVEPEPGEPAQSGYMATQANPAPPQMWDPAAVEGAIQSLDPGAGGAAGEVPAQSQ